MREAVVFNENNEPQIRLDFDAKDPDRMRANKIAEFKAAKEALRDAWKTNFQTKEKTPAIKKFREETRAEKRKVKAARKRPKPIKSAGVLEMLGHLLTPTDSLRAAVGRQKKTRFFSFKKYG